MAVSSADDRAFSTEQPEMNNADDAHAQSAAGPFISIPFHHTWAITDITQSGRLTYCRPCWLLMAADGHATK
jgi:hypothetical protein